MAEVLTATEIEALVRPYLDGGIQAVKTFVPERPAEPANAGWSFAVPADLYSQLSAYLELLLRWNTRTNLTAIREPKEIVRRHFGESLFAGVILSSLRATEDESHGTVLDVGSGAGFPGLPVQLLLPHLRVMLTESQGKKASFLREAVRTLGAKAEVFGARVEAMPSDRRFHFVTLRAVDHMELAVGLAAERLAANGWLLVLGEGSAAGDSSRIAVPGREKAFLEVSQARE